MNRNSLTQLSLNRRQLLAGAAATAAGLAAPAFAAGYPDKQLRWIVPYNAGGTTDVATRAIAEALSGALGQSIVIDNRPGGAGRVATQALLAAPADGYTVMTADNSILFNNWSLFDKLPFTPNSFEYVGMTGRFPLVLAVHQGVANNFEEWRNWLKRNGNRASYASPGVGSPHHIAWALLGDRLGAQLQHVPYKGDAAAIVDLIGGQIPMAMLGLVSAAQYLKDGRLRLLAVNWQSRLPALPEVPTLAEVGIRNFDLTAEQGVLAAAGTPPDIVRRLNQELGKVLASAAVREKLETLGMYPATMAPQEFKAYVAKQSAVAGEVIKRHGISIS
jgi:tripartite-type tricarboxylate transporter receptor subunit TctC